MQPLILITQNIRNEIGEQGISALNPLSGVYALRDVLQLGLHYVVKLTVDNAFRSVELLH